MAYRIISPRLGTPGDLWEPEVWVNVHALVEGGFIESVGSNSSPDKPAKAKVSKKAAPDATSAQE
jgi:DNA-binding Lrp family transcriptional regulator